MPCRLATGAGVCVTCVDTETGVVRIGVAVVVTGAAVVGKWRRCCRSRA